MMLKVYTDVGGIKYLYHVCPHVRKIIHSLKLVDYLQVQADNPWYTITCISNMASYFRGVDNSLLNTNGEVIIKIGNV